jgi:predicted SprT family Zn-dependent metalloprotease
MFFRPAAGNQPAEDHKLCHYKCDCGQTEFKFRLRKGERKLRRWCRACRKFIYPIAEPGRDHLANVNPWR